MKIDRGEMRQDEFNSTLAVLNNYALKSKKSIEPKNSLLNNARNFTKGEKKLLKALKMEYFR